MGRHGPQPQRRVIRRRIAELAQRGRRVAAWTGSSHRERRGLTAERGLFTPARFFLLGTVCVTELDDDGLLFTAPSRPLYLSRGREVRDKGDKRVAYLQWTACYSDPSSSLLLLSSLNLRKPQRRSPARIRVQLGNT